MEASFASDAAGALNTAAPFVVIVQANVAAAPLRLWIGRVASNVSPGATKRGASGIETSFGVTLRCTDAAPDAPLLSRPNTDLIPATADFLEETLRTSEFSGIRHAYAGALREATVLRALQGREDDARAFHERLRSFFAANGVTDGFPAFEDLPSAPDDWSARLLERAGFH